MDSILIGPNNIFVQLVMGTGEEGLELVMIV